MKIMKWMNLTPHAINVVEEDGSPVATFPKSGIVARRKQFLNFVANIGGVDTYASTFGEVEGLPPQHAGTGLIVSGIVRAARPERGDLYQPGRLIRDEEGNPIGCVGLSQ